MNLLEAVKKCSMFTADSKDSRVVMSRVANENGTVIATNGRFMAIAKTPEKETGGVVEAGTDEPLQNFPQWRRIDVEDNKLVGRVDFYKASLIPALEYLVKSWKEAVKAKLSRVDEASPFTVLVEVLGNRVVLTLQDTQTSTSFFVIKGSELDQGEYETHAYNAEYLLKCAKAVDGDMVSIRTQDSTRASVVCGTSDDFKVVLMPVRIRE